MVATLPSILRYLEPLIAFDTRNGVGEELPCAQWLKDKLAAHAPDVLTLGTSPRSRGRPDGAYILAIWGRPDMLINVHLDTVPSGEGWTVPPLKLTQKGDIYYGLGSADIKGAIACVLANLEQVKPHNLAILFSGDEEQGSEVMEEIIRRGALKDVKQAIICEPTMCRPGVRHRGFISYEVTYKGPGGHSSKADHIAAPLLDAAKLATALGEYGVSLRGHGPEGFKGICMNIGTVADDGAHNVVPTFASLRFSLRPPPRDDVKKRCQDIEKIIASGQSPDDVIQMTAFASFETQDHRAFEFIIPDIATHPMDMGFWTEAALLAEAGINAIVLGPGDIATAHRPDEHVSGAQLVKAAQIYARAMTGRPS